MQTVELLGGKHEQTCRSIIGACPSPLVIKHRNRPDHRAIQQEVMAWGAEEMPMLDGGADPDTRVFDALSQGATITRNMHLGSNFFSQRLEVPPLPPITISGRR